MKHPLPIAATATALIASAGMAVAAHAMPVSKPTSKPPAALRSDIILTAQQDKTIWRDLSSMSKQKAPASLRAADGAEVPKAVTLYAFPKKVADNILTLAGMKYARLNGKVLVVRQRDRKIESIITPALAKS
jgi:hypothetical protein